MKSGSNSISWGIIGCGDVTEVKTGPAFQKAENSQLLAVMRRDAAKAKDFAERHQVPVWYDKVSNILENEEIDAVYIATPPSSHLEYALKVLAAGKHVYLEKPMVLSVEESEVLCTSVNASNSKLVVAHYRRFLPIYVKVKALIEAKEIGAVKYADIKFFKEAANHSDENWRLNAAISGGGLFHDLAPHQLDLMYYFFGDYAGAKGFSYNQGGGKEAVDLVNGVISFKNGIQFRGIWDFGAPRHLVQDNCTIYGTHGSISFSFFGGEVSVVSGAKKRIYNFENPVHIQQPFIQQTINYFLGERDNPCSAEEGKSVTSIMDSFTESRDLSA